MGNCMGGSAKCANASTPFESKVNPGSSTSNSKAPPRNTSSSDRNTSSSDRNTGSSYRNSSSSDRNTSSSSRNTTDDVPGAREPAPPASVLKSFSMSDLRAATKNFGSTSYLGEGGFGCVYKGWIDEATLAPAKPGAADAKMVAIKKLKKESYQGHREWLTEVTYLGELHHDNLVKLVGYCSDSDSNKLLVYEYMLRGSLENHLFRRGSQPPLPWATRVAVAADVARGLAFLHSRDVIFRDLKSSNVLLDPDHRAKLSDFGLARAGPTGGKTHVSTRVVGTRGYAAPEYVATGHLSAKSDVYGFGVVLLELMTGLRALDEARGTAAELLVDWARPMLVGENRKVIRMMDTRLGGQYNKRQAQEVAALALRCLNSDPKSRPTMAGDVLPCLELLLKENTTKSSAAASARSATPVHRGHRHKG